MPKIYYVGGCVRDKILNVSPKDIDYVFVDDKTNDINESYSNMIKYLKDNNYKIFLESKNCYTVRCKKDQVVDFVLARKDIEYDEKSRIPKCVPATLYEDLERRDFTINSMAEDEGGNIYDYFEGKEDIKNKILRTPIDPYKSFSDDPLRLIRAMRFNITKDFKFCEELENAFNDDKLWNKIKHTVSEERIREELYKCFEYDTVKTIELLKSLNQNKINILFGNKLWLKPTLEKN
jgi:poly(A) polymerase